MNTPTVINAGYKKRLFWDGRAPDLETQVRASWSNPIEMAADPVQTARQLGSVSGYAPLFAEAYGDSEVTVARIEQAIATFIENNDVVGARVAISLPGPTSLARFINLPPVESNKVAEIVKYEAKQQIPFDLDDVIWDYQKISGSVDEDSGYMLNAEVGLFAMKREQVFETLQPFLDAGLEVDLVQIAPLALYNFVCYDQMGVRVDDDPAEDDDYTIVLDMGTDNTTLLITNGAKMPVRSAIAPIRMVSSVTP